MAFWKKSEDPWDVDPNQRRPASVYEAEESQTAEKGFFESIREDFTAWKEEKQAAAEAEANMPPEICPWCGGEMEKGYLCADRGGAGWTREKPGAFLGTMLAEERILVTDEGGLTSYKTCWYCRTCCKMTMEVKPAAGPNYVWDGNEVVTPAADEESNDDL